MSKIRIFGVPTQTGIGTHSQSIFEIGKRYKFSKFEFEFYNCQSSHEVSQAIKTSDNSDVNIYFLPELFASELKGLHIYYCVFEASRPSPGYEHWLDRFDYLFSPSEWGKECMISYGLPRENIFVIPEGVDPYAYHPFSNIIRSSDPFRIFMLGKYESRKGYEVALEAFKLAHIQLPQIELNIKPDWATPNGGIIPQEFLDLSGKYKGLPIVLMSGTVDQSTLINLYQRSDLFLFPSLCEGWGLPLIEAIACGVPVLSCNYGGHSEFLKSIDEFYFKIPYKLSAVNCDKWKQAYYHQDGNWGNWATVDPVILAQCIVDAVRSESRLLMGNNASKIIRTEFSWANSVDKLIHQIDLLIEKDFSVTNMKMTTSIL